MSFAAFTSALFVREGTTDWGHLVLPSVLYFNTLVLLASSASLERFRSSLPRGAVVATSSASRSILWLSLTLLLGLGFCAGQFAAWRELRAQGLYLATNPNSSFFYVLTVVHVLHVLAGILALFYLVAKILVSRVALRRSLIDNTAVYWHFIGLLWLYLFLLFRMKL